MADGSSAFLPTLYPSKISLSLFSCPDVSVFFDFFKNISPSGPSYAFSPPRKNLVTCHTIALSSDSVQRPLPLEGSSDPLVGVTSHFKSSWNSILLCGGRLVAKSCPTPATPWTVACQAPPSMGFSKQQYWSGLPFPSPIYSYTMYHNGNCMIIHVISNIMLISSFRMQTS